MTLDFFNLREAQVPLPLNSNNCLSYLPHWLLWEQHEWYNIYGKTWGTVGIVYHQVVFSLLCHSVYNSFHSRISPFSKDCMTFQGSTCAFGCLIFCPPYIKHLLSHLKPQEGIVSESWKQRKGIHSCLGLIIGWVGQDPCKLILFSDSELLKWLSRTGQASWTLYSFLNFFCRLCCCCWF